jgi:hypothetical protein
MNRDSTPAFALLALFVALLAFGARISRPPAEMVAADHSQPAGALVAELTLTGTVEGMPRVHQTTSAVLVTLRTARQPFDLVLAPASHMADVQLTFSKGDQIQVTGARGLLNDDDVVFVREVTKGTRTVALRTQCGAPLWVTP